MSADLTPLYLFITNSLQPIFLVRKLEEFSMLLTNSHKWPMRQSLTTHRSLLEKLLASISIAIPKDACYSASATTSFTSGSMRLSIASIPSFKVAVEEGQPEQAPCSLTVTMPWSNCSKAILPPSVSTAGRT